MRCLPAPVPSSQHAACSNGILPLHLQMLSFYRAHFLLNLRTGLFVGVPHALIGFGGNFLAFHPRQTLSIGCAMQSTPLASSNMRSEMSQVVSARNTANVSRNLLTPLSANPIDWWYVGHQRSRTISTHEEIGLHRPGLHLACERGWGRLQISVAWYTSILTVPIRIPWFTYADAGLMAEKAKDGSFGSREGGPHANPGSNRTNTKGSL